MAISGIGIEEKEQDEIMTICLTIKMCDIQEGGLLSFFVVVDNFLALSPNLTFKK